MSLNARSILTKTDELALVIHNQKSDIVMVSETWLSDVIPDEALYFPGIPGFSVIRNDRVNMRGGGVAVFVKDTIPFKIRHDFTSPDYECLWIILRPKWLPRSISKIALACVYLPPSLNSGAIEEFYDYFCNCYDALTSESPNLSIVVAGDFNSVSNGFQEKIITNNCRLKQVVKKPTRGTAILDLIFSNAHTLYEEPEVLAPLGSSDHCMIVWRPRVRTVNKNITRKIITRPIKNSSLQLFEDLISRQNWPMVYNSPCINSKVDAFLSVTLEMIDIVFPLKTFKVHEDDKLFISGKIKQMISKRDKLYQRGRTDDFKSLRNKIVLEIRKEKDKLYHEKIKPARVQDPKTWWKTLKKWLERNNKALIFLILQLKLH